MSVKSKTVSVGGNYEAFKQKWKKKKIINSKKTKALEEDKSDELREKFLGKILVK